MKLIFKTNNDLIPVFYIAKESKVNDTELDFLITNNFTKKEYYDNSKDRDDAYNNFINNFVVDNDSSNNSSSDSSNNDSSNNSSSDSNSNNSNFFK